MGVTLNELICQDCRERYTTTTLSDELQETWMCPGCTSTASPLVSTERTTHASIVKSLWATTCTSCQTVLHIYGSRTRLPTRNLDCPNCLERLKFDADDLDLTDIDPVQFENLYAFGLQNLPIKCADIYIVVGDNVEDASQSLQDSIDVFDSLEFIDEDDYDYECYGSLVDLQQFIESQDDWLETDVTKIEIEPQLPYSQHQSVMELLREAVIGRWEILCMESLCGASSPYLGAGIPDENLVRCPECGSGGVMAVRADSISDSVSVGSEQDTESS